MSASEAQLQAFLARVPYIRFLGMRAELAGDEMTAILPPAPHLVGNTFLQALHGGVIGAFLEMTALAQLAVAEPTRRMPKTIDVTIEYLRPVPVNEELRVEGFGARRAIRQNGAVRPHRIAPPGRPWAALPFQRGNPSA